MTVTLEQFMADFTPGERAKDSCQRCSDSISCSTIAAKAFCCSSGNAMAF